jgi:nucleoside-diphosphate kinase
MFDMKLHRTFLKRCKYPSIQLEDLRVGNQVSVYARQLKILSYGDDFTEGRLGTSAPENTVIIKPNAFGRTGQIMDLIISKNFFIMQFKMLRMTAAEAANYDASLASGACVAMQVDGKGVTDALAFLADAVFTKAGASPELFKKGATTASSMSCSVCVIKPTAMRTGKAGKIMDMIQQNKFNITAMEMFNLDRTAVQEFYEVYRGVVPEYNAMCEELTIGPCIAIEITGSANIVQEVREMVGPADPDVARAIRQNTTRALFGHDKVKNSIHCTDLSEDGPLESEFFFNILQKEQLMRGPHGNNYRI